jgi:hypothetical protein
MALQIEFAPRSGLTSPSLRALVTGAIFMVIAVGVFVALSGANRRISNQIELGRLTLRRAVPMPLPSSPNDLKREQGTRKAQRELNVDWDAMFETIESSRFDAITLFSIDSDPAAASLRLAGSGQSYGDILSFVERLSRRPSLTDVLLLSHQAAGTGPEAPVKFVITAHWRVQ